MSEAEWRQDRDLVARFLRDRDEASFRALYRRHSPALYALARRLLANERDAADDVLQDMWIRATLRLPQFRWESALRTWLSGILVNCCRERSREHWRWVSEDEQPAGQPIGDIRPLELTVDVERAIARLPPGSRSVFVLHDCFGLTHQEIATLLGIHPGTSKSQLFHAHRLLRAMLA